MNQNIFNLKKRIIKGCKIMLAVLFFLCALVLCGIEIYNKASMFLFYDVDEIQLEASSDGVISTSAVLPSNSAQSAILIEGSSGRIIYAKNKDARLPPASTTKVMTALVALNIVFADEQTEDADETSKTDVLSQMILISEHAAKAEGSSIFLSAGEKVSLEDLLYGMMLRSGNDAAIAVAEGTAGSEEEFIKLMNEQTEALGLKNTHFCNTNGLNDEDHYSSAYDLAMIAREAMKNEKFRDIAACKTWNASREGVDNYNYFYNKNKVIFQYEGGTGVKIGYTTAAGRCLVASARRSGMELIAVVLNDQNWFDDVYALFDYGFQCYENVEIAGKEQILTNVTVMDGEEKYVKVGTRESAVCPAIKDEQTEISIKYDLASAVKAPVMRWQEAGKLDVYANDKFVFSAPLFFMEDVDRKS